MRTRVFRRIVLNRRGQTVVEYLLTTLTLVTVFAGLYGFLQGQLRGLFRAAGIKILTAYY
ncbi:MAG: hypothetical protein HY552_03190 [Elusimicrobia bacterium]|nr:hypothetical protein [Elusimicrobiota bacterium]